MKEILLKPLRRYLRDKGITYEMIADDLGKSEATVVNWLKHGKISLKKLEELLKRYNIKMDVTYGSSAT